MNRRGFLAFLASAAGAAVAHTLDVDKLLWQPGERTFFLPTVATDRELGISIRFVQQFDCLPANWQEDVRQAAQALADRVDAVVANQVYRELRFNPNAFQWVMATFDNAPLRLSPDVVYGRGYVRLVSPNKWSDA